MKIETIKTYILTILVSISILLTFAIWNYQPNYDFLYNNQTEDVSEVDLGGLEKTKRDVVEPVSILFHNNDFYYGFTDPYDQKLFYQDMEDWILDDLNLETIPNLPTYDYQVEVIFPQPLPAEVIKNLFTFNDEHDFPTWSFERLLINLNNDTSSLEAHFLSTNDTEQLTFSVNDTSAYNNIWSLFQGDERLESYVVFDEGKKPIYLPESRLKIKNQTFKTEEIKPNLLVNELFTDQDDVKSNIGEKYYTDGQRGMRILDDGRRIEFINPIHLPVHDTDLLELLDLSVQSINAHKGWTEDDYRFVGFNEAEDSIRYRMYYNGYPIFNHNDLSIIEQSWKNQQLHLYRRPLFSLNHLFETDNELASGQDIIFYLKNNERYGVEYIEDIQVGYHFSFSENNTTNVTLRPAWFMSYKGNWIEIIMDELDEYAKGGD